jgi:hypothetical protein
MTSGVGDFGADAGALTFAVENPVRGKRVMGVPEIRSVVA